MKKNKKKVCNTFHYLVNVGPELKDKYFQLIDVVRYDLLTRVLIPEKLFALFLKMIFILKKAALMYEQITNREYYNGFCIDTRTGEVWSRI